MWFMRKKQGFTVYRLLIGGQSNASGRGVIDGSVEAASARVRMFKNNYTWGQAYEPTDDATGQLDAVSDDSTAAAHSFALRAAKQIVSGKSGRKVELIPCAKGGTRIAEWMPGVDHGDRTTLYGSACYRRYMAAPTGLSALLWYGHESQAESVLLIASYIADWTALVTQMRSADFGVAVPIIYVQLAKHTDPEPPSTPPYSERQHLIAESQRLMETGSGDASALAAHYMVVAFDLPLLDHIHLNAAAQRTLGDRIGLAFRQHVIGDAVDGTGPRLISTTHPGGDKTKILVKTTQVLHATMSSLADGQFRVYDGATEVTANIATVARDAGDDTAVLVTLSSAIIDTGTISYGNKVASGTGVTLANVLRNAAGLPLPQFGAKTIS